MSRLKLMGRSRGTASVLGAPAVRRPAAIVAGALIALLMSAAPAMATGGLGFGGPQVALAGVACGSPGDCTTVGQYYDGIGYGQLAAWSDTGGHWTWGTKLQAPSNAATNAFDTDNNSDGVSGVACPAAGDCVAVGSYLDRSGDLDPVLFTESGGVWHRGVEPRMPAGALHSTNPHAQLVGQTYLSGISCYSVGNCLAVGYYVDTTGNVQALMLREAGGVWGAGTEVQPPVVGAKLISKLNALTDVSCVSSGTCTAAGSYTDSSGHNQAFTVTESDGTVSADTALALPAGTYPYNPATDPTPLLTSVSCFDAADCATVGEYTIGNGTNAAGLLVNETSGTWQTAKAATLPADAAVPTAPAVQQAALLSASCTGVQACTATGFYVDQNGNAQGLLETYNGGTWTDAEASLPTGSPGTGSLSTRCIGCQEVFAGPVSCSSPGNCVAAGVFNNTADKELPLLLTQRNGTWSAGVQLPTPSDSGPVQEQGGLVGVSCPTLSATVTTDNDCTVTGSYEDKRNNFQAFATTQSASGSWGTPIELRVPKPDHEELLLSLNAVMKPTGKAARIAQIIKSNGYKLSYTAVEAGTLKVRWYARYHHRTRLIGSVVHYPNRAKVVKFYLRLTNIGRTALEHSTKLPVTVRASFAAAKGGTGGSVSAHGKFTLRK